VSCLLRVVVFSEQMLLDVQLPFAETVHPLGDDSAGDVHVILRRGFRFFGGVGELEDIVRRAVHFRSAPVNDVHFWLLSCAPVSGQCG